jgi:hypothetical protein
MRESWMLKKLCDPSISTVGCTEDNRGIRKTGNSLFLSEHLN